MAKSRPPTDFGALEEALNLATTGRYRTLKEVERQLETKLPKMSNRDRAVFDDICDGARQKYLRKAKAPNRFRDPIR